MANTAGMTSGIPALLRVPSIRSEIVDLYKRQKLFELFQYFGAWRQIDDDRYYSVRSQAGFYTLDTTGATSVTGSGTPTVTINGLVLAQSGKAVVGETVILPAGTQARIQSVTTASGLDTIVLQSYAAGTPNLTLVVGNVVRQFSNAQERGSNAPNPRNRGFDTIYNQVGIKRHSYAADDITKGRTGKSLYIKVDGHETEYEISKVQEYLQHRAEVASGLFMDQMSDPNFSATPTVTGANGRGVQTTRGLLPTIDLYGSAVAVTSAGTPAQADIENLIAKMAEVEGPEHYTLMGSTRSITRLSSFFKGLGSANTSPVRVNLANDERVIDFMVERVIYGSRTMDLVMVDVLDVPALFPTTGAEYKSVYAIPMGDYPVISESGKAAGSNPFIGVNYMPVKEPGVGTEMEAEVRDGALVQPPTSGTNVDQTTWCSIVGLETPKPEAMIKFTGVLA